MLIESHVQHAYLCIYCLHSCISLICLSYTVLHEMYDLINTCIYIYVCVYYLYVYLFVYVRMCDQMLKEKSSDITPNGALYQDLLHLRTCGVGDIVMRPDKCSEHMCLAEMFYPKDTIGPANCKCPSFHPSNCQVVVIWFCLDEEAGEPELIPEARRQKWFCPLKHQKHVTRGRVI